MTTVDDALALARFEETLERDGRQVLARARAIHEQNGVLAANLADMTNKFNALRTRCGAVEEILRSVDQIVKNPGAGRTQTNYEDLLRPDLRAMFARVMS